MSEDKIVSDAVFGFITLKPHIITIIDTPEFQRLRQIWQLGMVPFVYPTASHSRFEHSIGTYWLASRLLSQIQQQSYKDGEESLPKILPEDVKCVEIAALCHNIGHGPFSHVCDRIVLSHCFVKESEYQEKQFVKIWNILKGNENVNKMLEENSLDEKLICDLINGKTIKGKEILSGIVSNHESGMDVDKWDYLARDSSYLGHSSTNYRAEIERMIHRVRAIKDDDGIWKIAFRDTEALNMLMVFQLRHYMRQTAYQHRTVVAIEQMYSDGLEECDISSKCFEDVDWILDTTDSIFWNNIKKSTVFKRILTRQLYKPIFEAAKYEIVKDPKPEVEKHLDDLNVDRTKLRIAICEFNLGNNDDNPICKIPFYKKGKEQKIFRFLGKELPSHLRLDCNESRVIIFSTDKTQDVGIVKVKLADYFDKGKWKMTF